MFKIISHIEQIISQLFTKHPSCVSQDWIISHLFNFITILVLICEVITQECHKFHNQLTQRLLVQYSQYLRLEIQSPQVLNLNQIRHYNWKIKNMQSVKTINNNPQIKFMSVKKGEATIKDLSKEEMAKVMELARRLGEQTKLKQQYLNLYEDLKIEHQDTKRKLTEALIAQQRFAQQNKFVKLQLKNSLKRLEPFRPSFVPSKTDSKEDEDPNILKSDNKVSKGQCRSGSRNRNDQIHKLQSDIKKMAKQLKYFNPSLQFIQKEKEKQEQKQSRQEQRQNTFCQQKLRMYQTIKSRYQTNQSQSFIEDQVTKICAVQNKSNTYSNTTAKKSIELKHPKQVRVQKQTFYSSDLLDLVEMMQ